MVKEIRFCKFKRLVVWTKGNSVPERAFSGTEYARGAKNKLLWYAARFLKHSVRRTVFCGTKGIFGTGNALLWYAARFQRHSVPETPSYGTEYARGAKNRLLWYATHFLRHSVRRTGFCGTEGIFGTGNHHYGTGYIFIRRHSVPETPSYGTGCIFRAHNKKRDAEKLHPHNQFTQAIKP